MDFAHGRVCTLSGRRATRVRFSFVRRSSAGATKTHTSHLRRTVVDAVEEEKRWTAHFAKYTAYIQLFGTHVVHRSFSTPEFPDLGAWVHLQKVAWWNEIARLNGEVPFTSTRLCMRRRELLSAAGAAFVHACV